MSANECNPPTKSDVAWGWTSLGPDIAMAQFQKVMDRMIEERDAAVEATARARDARHELSFMLDELRILLGLDKSATTLSVLEYVRDRVRGTKKESKR